MSGHRNFRDRQVLRPGKLRGIHQSPDTLASSHLHAGPQTDFCRLPLLCRPSAVDHFPFAAFTESQLIPVVEIDIEPNGCKAAVRTRNRPQFNPGMTHMSRVNDARIFAAEGVPVHKAAALKDLHEALPLSSVRTLKASQSRAVASAPVAVGYHSHIFGPLEPAFRLERENTGLLKRIQVVPGAHIPW